MVSKNVKIGIAVVGGVILLPSLIGGGSQRPSTSGGGGGGFFGIPFGTGEPVNPNSTSDSFGISTPPVINIYESSLDFPTTSPPPSSSKKISSGGGFSKKQIKNIGEDFTQDLKKAVKEGGGFAGGVERHNIDNAFSPKKSRNLPTSDFLKKSRLGRIFE